ncbi:MAG: gamma carbonic anhydrase family protein [Actinomycetota bacterium]|jgi:carbonic anhydrase/acetyltransferase-like protein (isoleucine patch superfamily)
MPIYALGDLEPDIHPEAFVHPEAVVIGRVRIGERSTIWPQAVLRGDIEAGIHIGARTSIQDGSVVHTTPAQATTVGDDCVIGHLVHLEGCIIEDGSLVGSGSIVLHHARVETGALVAAAALVPNHMVVPAGSMALGVPARIKPDAVNPEMIANAAAAYLRYCERYRKDLRRLD